MTGCTLCRVAAGETSTLILCDWGPAVAVRPLNPAAPGHVMIIPRVHVRDVGTDPGVSATVMICAAELARAGGDCNVITSRGTSASQSEMHLHLHVVPRAADDGLVMPGWPHQTAAARESLDAVYRERAHLLANIASRVPSVLDVGSSWPVLFTYDEGVQASWHINPLDATLFDGIEEIDADDPRGRWNGHLTSDKYAAMARATAARFRAAHDERRPR